MQSRTNLKEYGAIKIYNVEVDNWTYVRPTRIGDIKQSVVLNDHNGWLICNGRSLNRSDYPLLFELIGTNFGNDDDDTFNLPDLQGRVPGTIGAGDGLTNRTQGSYVGAETHTLTALEMPVHNHGVTDPGHTHVVGNTVNFSTNGTDETPDGLDDGGGEIDCNTLYNTTSNPAFTGITTVTAGSGLAHNNMQPTLFIAHTFIYAKPTDR
jgi:microcystin-dependent protein